MSYILEALRKADQMRRRDGVPGLDAPQVTHTQARNPWVARGWIALLAVNALLILMLLWPDDSGEETEQESAVASTATRNPGFPEVDPPAPERSVDAPEAPVILRAIPPPAPSVRRSGSGARSR